MTTLIIVIAIVVGLIAIFALSGFMVCVIRIQEQDAKIDDLKREIRNVQDGGKEITRRMNEYQRSI